ncbi:MAG: pre-16S rRNA-processing nuclease YqgF [Armatimonadetes bacterium]|nr:pre-16S rRNA-processing nuclease YqgF [Armatimonadota bacterium]
MSYLEKTVLAIDPGSSKVGMALVRRTAEEEIQLLWRKVCPVDDLEVRLDEVREIANFALVIVGSGTKSKAIVERISRHAPGLGVLVVDEKNTTLAARERYWEYNKRRGWRRILPSSMQEPPEPVDDFVALILAERVLITE